MQRIKFTKTAINGLPLPTNGKRETYYDVDVPKLAIRITHTGSKTFYVIKRTGTRMTWVKLGVFPDMTVEKSRLAAESILGQFASGADPAAAKRSFKAEPTLSMLFAEYGERHGNKKLSWRDDQQRFRDYLQRPLGKLKVSEVSRAAVARVLSDAEQAGKSAATVRQIRALASILFSKAIEWGYLQSNPVKGIKVQGNVVHRERFLQAEELPRFFAALSNEPNTKMSNLILMALLTGARLTDICSMHWNEINLNSKIWRIPRTKNGTSQNVTLSEPAIAILESRQEKTAGSFVFPSASKSGHVTDPKKAIKRVLEAADIPYGRNVKNGFIFHDLRRTLGSWQAIKGASLAVIGKSLNHSSVQATQVYARLSDDPVRQSVNTATAAMLEAANVSVQTN
jgi:integrase